MSVGANKEKGRKAVGKIRKKVRSIQLPADITMQYTQENLENLSRKEIQSIAKDVGLKCNGKSVDLIKGILESQTAAQMEAVEPPPDVQSASETNPAGK